MLAAPPQICATTAPNRLGYADLAAIALIVTFVATVYGARLATQPIAGEESRWATGAREMLASGDWIVPRQQGQVFAERPPMNMWAMAVVGLLRGEVDLVAVRLPSVVGVLLTSLVIYYYGRALVSPFAALVGALVYPTFGQVLQIGRMGESEPLFALFVGASLLLWHVGYTRDWSPLATWSIGFACAALGALVKGPQAPVYFVAITAAYIGVRRDWQYILRWQYAAGAALFVAIIAAWQIPFYLATDWQAVASTWSGLAADRIHLRGLAEHIVTYPLETFACLLPWSPLLTALVKRDTRRQLTERRHVTTFLFTALLVAYPTVWLATGARGRYFMPLYPVVAVLVAVVVESCSLARISTYPWRAWHQFLLLSATLIAACGIAVGVAGVASPSLAATLYQARQFCAAFAVAAAVAVYMIWQSYRAPYRVVPTIAVVTIATFVGAAYTGAVINVNAARWNDPTHVVADFKKLLPPNTALVSLTPIEHRFAYYYEAPIGELPWPRHVDDLPENVDYFCFMRNPKDTPCKRMASRGRGTEMSAGMLPFAWEEVTAICVDRSVGKKGMRTVVLGRVIRPLRAEMTDATRPQSYSMAELRTRSSQLPR